MFSLVRPQSQQVHCFHTRLYRVCNMKMVVNCLAICDVSGSMMGTPMEVSVALGVLVLELSEEPWKGNLITFSANPTMQKIQGQDLKSKTQFVKRMEWGMNTNFQKVFDLIFEVASSNRLLGITRFEDYKTTSKNEERRNNRDLNIK